MDNNGGGLQAAADQHEIELMKQQVATSISGNIEAARKWLHEPAGESRCSIFRAPQALAGGIAETCRPSIVSIGPYHHGESELQMLEEHKWRYLHTMLERIQPYGIRLENLTDVVAPKEKIIRQCYSESTNNFSGPDLVNMMVLDGCFIIEYLHKFLHHCHQLSLHRHNAGHVQPTDILILNLFMSAFVRKDLLRLENQVPYFALEDLFEATKIPGGTFSLADRVSLFFQSFLRGSNKVQIRENNLKGVHLLDLFRLSLIPLNPDTYPVEESSSYYMIKSTSEFHRVGIKFKPREAITLLDIKFDRKNKIIEIPKIGMYDDDLNWMLPNMVAFEQCRGHWDGHITTYAFFMGFLVRTADDVQLLRDYKVISNVGLSNEDFASFFCDVTKDASSDIKQGYLASHYAVLNKSLRYEPVYLCWAQLVNAFHDNPWSALSGLAVLVTLAAMIQTVYAVLQYYHTK